MNNKQKKDLDWIAEEITSREYTKKEMETLMLLLKKKDQKGAWKILLKGKDFDACYRQHYNHQLTKVIHQELDNQQKSKEEKVETIINFCLDYLNQDINEEWKKKKNKALLFLTLAENEWSNAKKTAFNKYISKEITSDMKF